MLSELRHKLPDVLVYHGYHHTLEVYESARMLARCEGLQGINELRYLTAALTHDIGYIDSLDQHEMAGVEWVRRHLPDFGYSPKDVDEICLMVEDTIVGRPVRHSMGGLLRDADLDYLGTPDFYRIGRRLFYELKQIGTISNEWEWNSLQVKFLTQHQYYSRFSLQYREPVKRQYLNELMGWLQEHQSVYGNSEKNYYIHTHK